MRAHRPGDRLPRGWSWALGIVCVAVLLTVLVGRAHGMGLGQLALFEGFVLGLALLVALAVARRGR